MAIKVPSAHTYSSARQGVGMLARFVFSQLSYALGSLFIAQDVLDLNLGSPFLFEDIISGLTPLPRSLEFESPLPSAVIPSSPLPLFSSSFAEPFDAFVDSDASDSEDEEDDTQYISIPSTSPFYHPPPKPRSFTFAPWSESCLPSSSASFACDALSEDVGESAAILFHEKLDTVPYARDDVFIVDDEFHQVGAELYVSPFDVYQDIYLDALKNSVGLMSLYDEDLHQDVPVDFGEEDAYAEIYSGILVSYSVVCPPSIRFAHTRLCSRRL